MHPSNSLLTLLQDSILSQKPLIEPFLRHPPKGSIADRIAIYSDGFYLRLEEALLSDFQSLSLLMGSEAFSKLVHQYLTAYPSYSYSLNYLGQKLSQFLAETSPYNNTPCLAEIAAYEWAEAEAYTAADGRILHASDLQTLSADQWPALHFHLHPSAHLVPMHWNSFALINALRNQQKRLPTPKKQSRPQLVMVWRRELQVRYYELDPLERIMIKAIQNQASFVEICDQLSHTMKDEEEVAGYLVSKLQVWLQEQLLVQPPQTV
ncbi:MAG: DNA-binding domain-containing protein [Tatlockia sp.]|jgi:hypothetical protein